MKVESILIKNADYIVTMDSERRILRNESIYIEGNRIVEVGSREKSAERVIDAKGMIVLPGFVNTHHHMFQSLFRNVPFLQNKPIDVWIETMCEMSRELTEEAAYFSALTSMIELLLSGCTTSVDFLYIFPKGKEIFQQTIKAARDVGIRFHPVRGNISLGQSKNGIAPDDLIEDEKEILKESKRVIKLYHDPSRFSLTRVGLGPCTLFTSEREVFEGIRDLAREENVQMHTHLSESQWEVEYCIKNFGMRPAEYMKAIQWVGNDVVFAHCIHVDEKEIKIISETKTGVSHCPISNARGSGIAPVTEMLGQKVRIGIGVDGAASNDSSNMLEEMRWARTLQGARPGFTYLKPSQVLEMGTLGGALVLNRDDIGSIEKNKAADIAVFDVKHIGFAGAVHDPIGSLIASQAINAKYVLVDGKIIVEDGKLVTVDAEEVIQKQNELAKEIVQKAEKETGKPLSKVEWVRAF
jgi:cytosine/adenosine deaminase-related metal-dependent hydrolase